MIPGNAQPVLLGSSQTQVTSNQDGLASVVPSPGNVGPCDVFITAGAGVATATFHMENLAAIVTLSPKQNPAKVQPRRPIPNHRLADDSTNAISLFAIAGDVPSGVPTVDSEASKPDMPGDVDRSNEEPQIYEPSALADPLAAKDLKKAFPSHAQTLPEERKGPPAALASPATGGWSPVDKRSCRALVGGSRLF